MKNILPKFLFMVLFGVIFLGCGSVTRVSSSQTTDLSGRWNDTDSRLVAEEMTKSVIEETWREDFINTHQNNKPVVIVGVILNKSHEHIEAETFIKDIEREVIKTKTVRIVANSVFREKLRNEKMNQGGFVNPTTQKQFGRELGADFMMYGSINAIVDTHKKNKVVFYQINLELADLATNEVVWIGDKKIKKILKRR